jgi:alpha-beta hydrolase superfamily lysophospholipase
VNASDHRFGQTSVKSTIVLAHGAFADASSWNDVIERLQQQGYTSMHAGSRRGARRRR